MYYNVKNYGAVGNNVVDDTTAFQTAINAAVLHSGTLFIPTPSYQYKISDTLNIIPSAGEQVHMDIVAEGNNGQIGWHGGDKKTIFYSAGWKDSFISGVNVNVVDKSGIKVWEIADPEGAESCGNVSFRDCLIGLIGTTEDSYGWYCGDPVYGQDISSLVFINCQINGADNTKGNIGWYAAHANCLGFTWQGGGGFHLSKLFSMAENGGGAHTWISPVCGYNALDFYFGPSSQHGLTVIGGRFECGNRLVETVDYPNSYHLATAPITFMGTMISAYALTDDIMFAIDCPASILLQNTQIVNHYQDDYTDRLFHLLGGDDGKGSLTITGGAIQADNPFWTADRGDWAVKVENVGKPESNGSLTARHGE